MMKDMFSFTFFLFFFFCKGVEQNMAFLCGFFISSCLFNNYTSRISFIQFFPAFNLLGVLGLAMSAC